MSGRKISDKGGYPGSSDAMMKSGNRLSHESSAEGAGHLGSIYPDTTGQIKRDQMKGVGQIKAHPMKEGYRY